MESLNCYYNVIKSIPEAITQLQLLTHLNLSRNQLAVLPVSLCVLSSLEVLCASNNKLVSLPEEIGKLDRLMDLDVSCNEISHLPPQIGDLSSLRSLNLRRNLLVELPLDICKLSLRKLDISSNRIEKIPTVFRKLETLEEIILEHNPLSSPPAHICTRGRQHIMKYLQIEAIREDRKRGILTDSEMKRPFRKSLPPQHRHNGKIQRTSDEFRNILDNPEPKWKRHTVLSSDSGYSTTESLDKVGWSQNEELQRQKMEYEQRKKAAEQIRLQQEEKEREDRRRAALKVQEEQRALLEKQKQEMKLEAERRQQEENLRFEEQQRLLREQAQQEEEARLREEEARVQEEARIREEEKARAEAKQQEEARKGKAANTNNSIYEHPLPPHWAQPVHGSYHGYGLVQQDYQEYPLYEEAAHDSYFGMAEPYSSAPDNCLSEWEYRNALSSHSFKEQRRIANTQQYRRTTSDSAKRGIPTPINAHVDNHNHINRNGIADDDVSEPIPPLSPSLANPSSSKATTPTSTIPGLLRVQGGEKGSQSPAVRRSKGNERSNVPTPSAGRSVSRTSSTSSVNSVQSQGSSGRTPATSSTTNTSTTSTAVRSKNHITPNSTPKNARRTIGRIEGDNEKPQGRMYTQPSTTYSRLRPPTTSFRREEELKQKQQQQVKIQQQGESQKLKSRVEEQRGKAPAREGVAMGSKRQGASDGEDKRRSNQSRAGATTAGRGGRNAAVKVLEDYKDANPNFTVRRRDEMHREENQQLEMLRQTIESRLKVTLPDNLPEALRDGVVLCHLANLIRPRSVASIHVPSPAVPKLTLAKCRRNVENFLEACKKIGVDQEQICAPADIMDERGVQRVAITVAALVAIGTNPRQSAV
ncbi:leucine-rich repeat and calponin homology domain-containing protein 2-like isoform X16 [Pomacea canaliculata]|uniref:leucine-rich repeat and calponin homology domain-containing protein 2-like isoform X16 n=1 Tax=Pomacea canaliculata TaxID=400727 RepID=UPI000D73F78E|nr:leucine-rich repeat and calponin homology domain-containing protein 2-like isoform X16 [Pomacea canaliculata]